MCSETSLLFLSLFLKFNLKRMLDFLKFGLGITMGYLISVGAYKPYSSSIEPSCFFLCVNTGGWSNQTGLKNTEDVNLHFLRICDE